MTEALQADVTDQVRHVKVDDIVAESREYSDAEKIEIEQELALIYSGKPMRPICLTTGGWLMGALKGRFKVVSGELRVEVARRLGFGEVPALVLPDGANTTAVARLTLRLNRAPHPVATANDLAAFKREAKCSDGDLAKLFMPGKSRATVNNLLRIARLPVDWQRDILALPKTPATSLLVGLARVEDHERRRVLFDRLMDGTLTRRALRAESLLATSAADAEPRAAAPSNSADAEPMTAHAGDEPLQPSSGLTRHGGYEAKVLRVVRSRIEELDILLHEINPTPDDAASAEWHALRPIMDRIRNRVFEIARIVRGGIKRPIAA